MTMTTKPTTKQVAAYLQTVSLIAQMIKSVPSIPAGHLYASVMSMMDLDTFNGIIDRLVAVELVKKAPSHLLTWIGPK